ncbi:MAG: polyketide synthase, partial [Gammaproteobacteria bacterium]|nr:polyketide synthase [Gammaproteobacteria bacterium]
MNGVTSVVGVTLCTDYDSEGALSFHEYIHYRDGQGKIFDTMLSFHEAHGATIERALKGYRPEDTANEGFGPLISYDILAQRNLHCLQKYRGEREEEKKTATSSILITENISQRSITSFLEDKIKALLGESNSGFEIDRPLMEMGLDSADLLELQNQIIKKFETSLEPSFFFQYTTVGKVVEYLVSTLSISNEAGENVSVLKESKFYEDKGLVDTTNTPGSVHLLRSPQSDGIEETDVAIVGISCKLPGGIETTGELWELLKSGGSAIEKLPPGRFEWPESKNPEIYPGIDHGGFMRDADSFDAAFFRISPKEAEMMDPQQRILLELSWSCLEDAGIVPDNVKSTNTGVFIGASGSDYSKLLQDSGVEVEAHHGIGNSMAVLANRISYFFDLTGPSMQIDTACSSSLVAVHTAVQSLRRGECLMALVGGVNLICYPAHSMAYYKAGMLAPDGVSKVFDKSANGYVRAEGAVMLALKPLQRAIEDRDFIYAVIKGSALNHGGLSGGLTVPNPQKQSDLLMSAWKNAVINPGNLSYLEAHGTGTSLGDPIEVQGVKQAFVGFSQHKKIMPCGIGSLKSNLGHLEAAAGIAGLLKIVLAMQRKEIPGSIHFKTLNPGIELEGFPLYIVTRHQEWLVERDQKRLAGVSSFGSGGANAHVVLEEYRQTGKDVTTQEFYLFVISASTLERLRAYAERISSWIKKYQEQINISDFIYTFQVGRTAMQERLAIKVRGFRDLQSKLKKWLEGEDGLANCWHDDSKKSHSMFYNLVKGKSGKQVIDSALVEKDLDQLATLWILGVEIAWKALYEAKPRRIPVPTYPFSRNHYWIIGGNQRCMHKDAKKRFTLHPLLHENTSDFSKQCFMSTFTGNEFFLTDHQVKGKKVFPGVGYLEMARAAVEKSSGEREEGTAIYLKNIVWIQPIVVNGATQKVHIGLFEDDSCQIQYEVYTESDNEEEAA